MRGGAHSYVAQVSRRAVPSACAGEPYADRGAAQAGTEITKKDRFRTETGLIHWVATSQAEVRRITRTGSF